jgi:hypothetical protein
MTSLARQQLLPEGLCNGPERVVFDAVERGNQGQIPEAISTCYACPIRNDCYGQIFDAGEAIMTTSVQGTVLAGIYVHKSRAAANSNHRQWLPSDPTQSPIDLLETVRAERIHSPIVMASRKDLATMNRVFEELAQTSPELVATVGKEHALRATRSLHYNLGALLVGTQMERVFEETDVGLLATRLLLGDVRDLPFETSEAITKAFILPKSRQLSMMRYAKVKSHRQDIERQMSKDIEPGNILDQEPAEALAAIRSAVTKKQIHLKHKAAVPQQPTVNALAAEFAADYGNSPSTQHAVDVYVRAIARHTRRFADRAQNTPLTPDELCDGARHFLDQVALFRAHNIPRPAIRAAQTSLDSLLTLEEKWAARGISSRTFMNILSLSVIDVEPYLQRHLDHYGPDKPDLEQSHRIISHDAPATTKEDSKPLQDFLEDDKARDPADMLVDRQEQADMFDRIGHHLQALPLDHVLAVALVLDLPVNEDIDIAALCKRLDIPVAQLSAFVSEHVLPTLGAIITSQTT